MLQLGRTVMTRGIAAEVEKGNISEADLTRLLDRHRSGDWGNLCCNDRELNEYAVMNNERVFSSYDVEGIGKVWVITEADRSVTTILFPSEY